MTFQSGDVVVSTYSDNLFSIDLLIDLIDYEMWLCKHLHNNGNSSNTHLSRNTLNGCRLKYKCKNLIAWVLI